MDAKERAAQNRKLGTEAWPVWCSVHGDQVWIRLRVQAGAKQNQICGERDGALCLRVTAPAVEGKANRALLAFVSSVLKIPRSNIQLVHGATSRVKTLAVRAANPRDVWHRLLAACSP